MNQMSSITNANALLLEDLFAQAFPVSIVVALLLAESLFPTLHAIIAWPYPLDP